MRGVTALFLFAFASGQAQDSSTVTLDNGVQLKVEANFGDPTGQETLTVQLARANGNSFYRIFRDQNQLAVYAYKLVLELAGDGSAVRATAQAYDDQFMQQFPNADGGKPTPTLAMERPLDPLGSGQSATLDLFEIPGVGLHVTETLSVQLDSLRTPGPLRFADLEVSVDGKVIPVAQQLPVSGRFAMFYLPGHGAFVFSATDVGHGFIKAGVIDGNRMEFNLENQAYDCAASQPILTRPETGQLWVLRLPDYQPEGNWTTHPRTGSTRPAADQFFAAASDSLSWWVQ